MKNFALIRFCFCAFVATALSLTASAQTALGIIKAAKVQGQVTKTAADGTTAALKDGDLVTESDAVVTGKESSVVLVFNNGSSVRVGADSRLAIDEFKMDPLEQDINAATLKAEPTKSKTALNLSYGEMVGDVKKLNSASSYSIKTPVGAAGIRGTIYRIVFRPSADGKAFFTVSTAEGRVVMQGVTANEVPVEAGKEVVVEIDVPDTASTTPAAPPKVVTQDLPPATTDAINTATTAITQVLTTTVLTNTPPAPTPPTTETKSETKTETPTPETKTETPTPTLTANTPTTPTPTPQPTAPHLTPEAGK